MINALLVVAGPLLPFALFSSASVGDARHEHGTTPTA